MEMLYLRREGSVHLPLNGLSYHLVCAHCCKNTKVDELQINNLDKEFTKPHETMDDQHLKQSLEDETILYNNNTTVPYLSLFIIPKGTYS